jgi:integrase
MPTKKTKRDYENLAKNFYKKRLGDEPPSPKRICDALAGCAEQYRPAYWRRLRNALEFDQRQKGYSKAADRIASTRNPMTTIVGGQGIIDPTLRGETAPKQKRAKGINSDDLARLKQAAYDYLDRDGGDVLSALYIAEHLGVRPAEMLSLRIDSDNGLVHVTGVKRSEEGNRGADRTLRLLGGSAAAEVLSGALETLRASEQKRPGVIHRVQTRLDRITKSLWPRRKGRPTLYSLRHRIGSQLKASGADRRAIAYIMGHQATQSAEVYGDRRSAKRSGGLSLQVGEHESQAFQGRENHREPHAPHEQKAKPAKATAKQQESTVAPGLPAFRGPSGPSM